MSADQRTKHLVVVTGPTAVGKTQTALRLAGHFQTEVISCDSRQFYSGMQIGTARPAREELQGIPHHFLGHLRPEEDYNVSDFEQDALKLLDRLFTDKDMVIMVGGSGLYINAVCYGIDDLPDADETLRKDLKKTLDVSGLATLKEKLRELDPVYYEQVDLNNPNRIMRALEVCMVTGRPYSSQRLDKRKERDFELIMIGLNMDRQALFKRIHRRTMTMMENGLLEEARSLYAFRHCNSLNTVGYKELFRYFEGVYTLEQAVEKINTHTRRYAKRQLTWLGKDPDILWFHPKDHSLIEGYIEKKTRAGG